MSSHNSRKSQEWTVGSIVTFKDRNTGDQFHGEVYHLSPRPHGSEMGIRNVTVWRVDGRCEHQGSYMCNQKDITVTESAPSRKSQEWTVGSIVAFKDRRTGDHFHGEVYHLSPRPHGSEMGIKNVTVWRVDGRCEYQGSYMCNLKDITDDQDNNGDDGSSSKSI